MQGGVGVRVGGLRELNQTLNVSVRHLISKPTNAHLKMHNGGNSTREGNTYLRI